VSHPYAGQQPREHADPRVLWLCTDLELPPLGGGSIYAQGLARALASQGCRVTILGATESPPPDDGDVSWRLAAKVTRSRARSIFSSRPNMTARFDLGDLRDELAMALEESWDLVVLNHLASAWAVRLVARAARRGRVGAWWYASQNNEVAIWRRSITAAGMSRLDRAARFVDLPRVAWAQRTLVQRADAVSVITLADMGTLAAAGARRLIHAPPGRTTPVGAWLPPSESRPTGVLIAGSYTWRLKLANLRELLNAAVGHWDAESVPTTVAGKISRDDLAALTSEYPSVRFLGGVPDLRATYPLARLAIVHEPLGGGFKIKSVDYVFSGLPIATTNDSMCGFPPDAIARFPTLEDLVEGVPLLIRDTERLDRLRLTARDFAKRRFDWTRSGKTLVSALKDQQSRVEL